jgi:hypothetical protein
LRVRSPLGQPGGSRWPCYPHGPSRCVPVRRLERLNSRKEKGPRGLYVSGSSWALKVISGPDLTSFPDGQRRLWGVSFSWAWRKLPSSQTRPEQPPLAGRPGIRRYFEVRGGLALRGSFKRVMTASSLRAPLNPDLSRRTLPQCRNPSWDLLSPGGQASCSTCVGLGPTHVAEKSSSVCSQNQP